MNLSGIARKILCSLGLLTFGSLLCSHCGRPLSRSQTRYTWDDALRAFESLRNSKQVFPPPRPYCPTCIFKLGLECYVAITDFWGSQCGLNKKAIWLPITSTSGANFRAEMGINMKAIPLIEMDGETIT
jgi:hypothetical protein